MSHVESLLDVTNCMQGFTNQELSIIAEFFSVCTRNSASNIKEYHDLISQIINRSKKDMFSFRGWRTSYYLHLFPLRDLSTKEDYVMIFGDLRKIPSYCIENTPFKFPTKHFGQSAGEFWHAHPSFTIRDTRFKTFRWGKLRPRTQELYFSFYAAKPSYEKFHSMVSPPLRCEVDSGDSSSDSNSNSPLECQSGVVEDFSSTLEGEVETKDNKPVASPQSDLPPVGYGNVYAKQETNKQSIDSLNRQIVSSGNPDAIKWEQNKKLKTQATKFFG